MPAIDINQQTLHSNPIIASNPYVDSISNNKVENVDNAIGGRIRSDSVKQTIVIDEPQWDNIMPRMQSNSVPSNSVEIDSNNKNEEIISTGVATDINVCLFVFVICVVFALI